MQFWLLYFAVAIHFACGFVAAIYIVGNNCSQVKYAGMNGELGIHDNTNNGRTTSAVYHFNKRLKLSASPAIVCTIAKYLRSILS